MDILPCKPYISRVDGRKLLRRPDGSAFKLYYVSLLGRGKPEPYDWGASPGKAEAFEAALAGLAPEGVGFITAFTPIVKIFRFAPSAETIMHVRVVNPATMAPLDLARPEGYMEFACYAEAALAADEYRAWAAAATVEEYLETFSHFEGGPVVKNDKLAAWAGRQG
jgi:hypothetical protein